MFVWSVQTILQDFEVYLPEIASLFDAIGSAYGTAGEQEAVNRAFALSPAISIDYGVMENPLGYLFIVPLI